MEKNHDCTCTSISLSSQERHICHWYTSCVSSTSGRSRRSDGANWDRYVRSKGLSNSRLLQAPQYDHSLKVASFKLCILKTGMFFNVIMSSALVRVKYSLCRQRIDRKDVLSQQFLIYILTKERTSINFLVSERYRNSSFWRFLTYGCSINDGDCLDALDLFK